MLSQSFHQRLKDLEDHIASDQKLLKDFEEVLRYETNPRVMGGYRRDIERQRESLAKYKQEYAELKQEFAATPDAQMQNVEGQLQQMDAKLNVLLSGQYAISENQNQIRLIPEPASIQQKILILAAIPHGLRLDKEIREIEEAIRRATNRDLFEIRIRTAVRPPDIRRAIAEEQPQIVHFCGHGLENGSLLLEDDGGNNKPVPPEGLAALFKLHADYVNCVLLNACYSERIAIAISQYINYAIGMNQPIEDKAAIAFAQGFYDGLGYKNSGVQYLFQRAFDEGMVAIEMENLAQGSIPVLKKKL